MTDRYAVIGNPVAHSKSPEIHAMFARETGQDISYERILAPLDRFSETVKAFRDSGGRGANVTVPFKLEAFRYAKTHSTRATASGAVNTMRFDADGAHGDNTDGIGLVRDIERNIGLKVTGRQVLLLGAGGAARGVVGELLNAGAARLIVANRTHARAVDIAAMMAHAGVIGALPLEALHAHRFDIVINATSASLGDELPDVPSTCFAGGSLAYDMVYGRITPFLAFAARAGARTADGLGMLVEQAAEAYYLWRGARPSTAPVIAQLRKPAPNK